MATTLFRAPTDSINFRDRAFQLLVLELGINFLLAVFRYFFLTS